MQRTTSTNVYTDFEHVDNANARCELDTQADTICAGKNFRLLALTGQTCDVSGFHQSFESVKDVPIAQVATAVTLENGETIVLVINEALYFGAQMNHSLINPNQIRAFMASMFPITRTTENAISASHAMNALFPSAPKVLQSILTLSYRLILCWSLHAISK